MLLKPKPLVLMILDGWGYSPPKPYNAITLANTPQFDEWWGKYPHCLLEASSYSVGLPDKQMGNSEVGHMHMGAGRVILQELTQINQAIKSHQFDKNSVLLHLIQSLKSSGKFLHVMGLFSNGGVHSHENHLFAFLKLCHRQGLHNVCLHLFLDGRDTAPQSALESLLRLYQRIEKYPEIKICSLSGRYFAMDRDKRWERVKPVFELLTEGKGDFWFETAEEAIHHFYAEGKFDEFIPPTKIGANKFIESGDSLFFFNFRADRARQLTEAFLSQSFKGFERSCRPRLAHLVSMTDYGEYLPTEVVFPPVKMTNTLGEVLSRHGLHQLRIAETEKYAHVTFFFNGGSEQLFPNEKRLLIPSPLVPTYDLLPKMSAPKLTEALLKAIKSKKYDVIICNYANADMVGHTGNLKATIEAIEYLDHCFQRIGKALVDVEGGLLITADHGNAECMFDDFLNQPHTAHTCEPVPFLFVGKGWERVSSTAARNTDDNLIQGSLVDIAPTILALLGLDQPKEMTGQSLLKKRY